MKDTKIGVAQGGWTGGKFRGVWRCKCWTVVGREVEKVPDQYVDEDVEIIGVEIFLCR